MINYRFVYHVSDVYIKSQPAGARPDYVWHVRWKTERLLELFAELFIKKL